MANTVETFPAKLKYLREKRGISRRVLSELAGMSKNMVSVYENGEADPGTVALVALADALDVSVDCLLGRE